MKHKVLVLNQSYQPVKAISWERALCMFFLDKVEILKEYEDWEVHSATRAYSVPAVIRMLSKTKLKPTKIKLSRANIYKRDSYTCLYCGNKFHESQLTLDHVIPKSNGGKTSWINIATCCTKCNSRKSNRTPQQANMRLLSQPKYPGMLMDSSILKYFSETIPKEWEMWFAGT